MWEEINFAIKIGCLAALALSSMLAACAAVAGVLFVALDVFLKLGWHIL